MTIRRPLVASPRNSWCTLPLSSLDWSEWFTDDSFGAHYLHVAGPCGTFQYVRCRRSLCPRLAMRGGKLYWLIDGESDAQTD